MCCICLNLTFGLVTLLSDMAKSLKLWVRRKMMLRKDKKIRTFMMKKYPPHALKTIVNAGIAGHSIQEEQVNAHLRRINFIQKHMKDSRLARELDQVPDDSRSIEKSLSSSGSSSSSSEDEVKAKVTISSKLKSVNFNPSPVKVTSVDIKFDQTELGMAVNSILDKVKVPHDTVLVPAKEVKSEGEKKTQVVVERPAPVVFVK